MRPTESQMSRALVADQDKNRLKETAQKRMDSNAALVDNAMLQSDNQSGLDFISWSAIIKG